MLRRWVMLVAALVLLSGCGGAGEANPEKIGPRGVDELTIPTPSPDPGDFVAGAENPWFPIETGMSWQYDVTGGSAVRFDVSDTGARERIAGVSCSVVHEVATDADGKVVSKEDRYYAVDQRGDVWLFGQTGQHAWRAGEQGAEAGLVMPAKPRDGDGWLQERAPDLADRSTAVTLQATRTVPAGTFAGLLLLEDSSTLPSQLLTVQRYYAEGTGLVAETTTVGGTQALALVKVTTPAQ